MGLEVIKEKRSEADKVRHIIFFLLLFQTDSDDEDNMPAIKKGVAPSEVS